MIYIILGVIAILSFFIGIFVAINMLQKNNYSEEDMPNKDHELIYDSNNEEETRKVELVDFQDLLDLDGDVIEAEPAPLVPEEHLTKAEREIKRLKSKIKVMETREQSSQFELKKLKEEFEKKSLKNKEQN